jgi:glutamine synthetase
VIKLGVNKIPEVMKDNTDRNRTSPFAFTGNKFEFRAVGSSASTAFPVTLLNTAVADGIQEVTQLLKEKLKTEKQLDAAIIQVIKQVAKETKTIRFEGNNYSDEWVKEAAKRGLLNLRKTPEALAQIVDKKSIEVLTQLGIFSEAEIHSRYHVRVERFVKNLLIEADTLRQMVDTIILPTVYGYQGDLAQTVVSAKAAGVSAPQEKTLKEISQLLEKITKKRDEFEKVYSQVEKLATEEEKASLLSLGVSQAMLEVRELCDALEAIVSDEYWPLPKYREMLFLSS